MPRTKRRTVKRPSVDLNMTANATMANQPKNIKETLDEFDREKENIEDYFSSALENAINLIENSVLMVKINLASSLNSDLYSYVSHANMSDSTYHRLIKIDKCNPDKSDSAAITSTKKEVERSTRTATKTTAVRTTRQKSATTTSRTNTVTATKHQSATRVDDRLPLIEKNETKFKTPVNRPPIPASATVTPKVNMFEPISMMRRPNQGEVALSMTGSPLMVSSVSRDDMATVSVPLANGNILSILPRAGATMDISFDEQTKNELLLLKGNIEGLLNMKSGL